MSTGNAVKYGATGAVAGSAFGPIGTVVGGAGGAILGALTGNSSGPGYQPNQGNYTYGQSRDAGQGADVNSANRIAAGFGAQGQSQLDQGQQYGAGAQTQRDFAMGAQDRSAPQLQQDALDRQRQIAALGGTNATAAQLQQLGTAPMGPSVAAAQMMQGQDAANQQALALAHSGRSLGGGAAALQQAQFANAQGQQQVIGQAATAALQEQQNYRQMQLGALGAAQQGYGQAGQQSGAINAADLGLQAQNAQLMQGQQGINNQTSATFGQLGQGMDTTGLGYTQAGLQSQQSGLHVLDQQAAANQKFASDWQNAANQHDATNQANANANQATFSSLAGSAATMAASDRDVKQGIMPAGGVDDQQLGSDDMMQRQARMDANQAQIARQNQAAASPGSQGQAYAPPSQPGYGTTPSSAQLQQYGAGNSMPMPLSPLQMPSGVAGGVVSQDPNVLAPGVRSFNHALAPAPMPAPAAQPAQAPVQLGGAASSTGHVNAGHGISSDVTNKKDIAAADGGKSPWTNWGALAQALGMKKGAGPNTGAAVRDPNNPSQSISPYANIGIASHQAGAAPTATYSPQQIAAVNPYGPQSQMAAMPAQSDAPSTWGGSITPVQPGYDTGALDAAYAQQQAVPPGFQISDAHSKAQIQALSSQNQALIAALRPPDAGPSQEMLNQAAADQDLGAKLQYRPSGAGPSMAMLQQAAADQDADPVPAPDRPAIDLRPARPYSYQYKDPSRHGAGRFFGPMAQDLEQTPAGASVVKRAPDGTKMVDTSRLSLVNTGAISDLQRQIAALGGQQVAALSGRSSYPTTRPPGVY